MIGAARSGLAGAAGAFAAGAGAGLAELPPAATPPVEAAKPRIVKLQKIVLLRVRTRTTTTSFVGLRG